MTAWLGLMGLVLGSYLIGAIPFGYLVARRRGVDLFAQGSGNIGATNVGRVLGRGYGILVFVLDFAKGAVPVLAAVLLSVGQGLTALPPGTAEVAAAAAAFLGHLFPIYLGFRGGKGVATGAGTVAVLMPLPTLAAGLAWLVLAASSRYVSLASLGAAGLLCGQRLLLVGAPWSWDNLVITLFCLLICGLVVVRHHGNIRRLFQGTENRLEDSATMSTLAKTLHVLALGLCFGTLIFFTLTGLVLVQAFEQVSSLPADQRPQWLPLPPEMDRTPPPSKRFPDPVRKEQGSRLFGYAVSPLFPWYFGIQTICLAIALLTAIPWCLASGSSRVDQVRAWLLFMALIGAGSGWWLEHVVSDLRQARNDLTDAVLGATIHRPGTILKAEEARAKFGRWHGYSLMVNMATLLLVTVAMALAAQLPASGRPGGNAGGECLLPAALPAEAPAARAENHGQFPGIQGPESSGPPLIS